MHVCHREKKKKKSFVVAVVFVDTHTTQTPKYNNHVQDEFDNHVFLSSLK